MKYARHILLIILTGILLGGALWARSKADDEVCKKVEVVVMNNDSTTFVTSQGVLAEIRRHNLKLEGIPMWQINTLKVEQVLNASPYLEDVVCVKGQNGVLVIQVTQMLPVMRVFDGNTSYYVNSAGKRMEASTTFFCDVPVVYGHFTKAYGPEKLLPMVQYVSNDSVLNSIVSMYQFKGPNDIFVVPCFTGHVVNMGSVDNYESKFKKLLLFYKKVMPARGWQTYDTISVKWDHQVVATLRDRRMAAQVLDSLNTDETDPTCIDMGNQSDTQAGNANTVEALDKKAEEKKATEKKAPEKKQETKPAEKKQDTKAADKKKETKATATDTKKSTAKATDKKTDTKKADTKKADTKKTDTKKAAATSSTKKASSTATSSTKKSSTSSSTSKQSGASSKSTTKTTTKTTTNKKK